MLGNESLTRAPEKLETEADAYAFLEGLRWGEDGPTECPHCGSKKGAWYLKPKDPEGRKSKGGSTARSQRRVWKCRENSCRRQFSVLTNTVLHATKMPVRAWIGTIIDLCEDRSGVSARDVAARWGVTEKSAWAMLNRIQEALAEPEVAGAQLHSNAPLWFELAPDEAASVDQQRRTNEAAAAEELARRRQAERQAAARVERDVQRALAEAAAPAAAPQTEAQGAPKAATQHGDAAAVSRAPEVGLHPVSSGDTHSDDRDIESKTGPSEVAPAAAYGEERPRKRRDPDVEKQVKSDVDRVLAEVFGDALADQRRAQNGPNTSPGLGRDAVFVASVGEHESGSASAAQDPLAAESISKKKLSKAARKKQKKQARVAARKRLNKGPAPDPQPVDNSAELGGRGSASPNPDAPNRLARAHARREQRQRGIAAPQGQDSLSESLGGGWLEGSPAADADRRHRVSVERGPTEEIVAAELGPSWASTGADVLGETPKEESALEHQHELVADETVADD